MPGARSEDKADFLTTVTGPCSPCRQGRSSSAGAQRVIKGSLAVRAQLSRLGAWRDVQRQGAVTRALQPSRQSRPFRTPAFRRGRQKP